MECKAATEYEISTFPRVVIIDAAGKIAYSGMEGGGAIIQKLQEINRETPAYRTHPREVLLAFGACLIKPVRLIARRTIA